MSLTGFAGSALLVLIAQIPLVVKLYFDYRARRSELRSKLFDKQMNAFHLLYTHSSDVQAALHEVIFLLPIANTEHDKAPFSSVELRAAVGEAWSKWSKTKKRYEYVMPSSVLRLVFQYEEIASHAFAGIAGIETRDQLVEAWEQLSTTFNALQNELRRAAGIETLSREVLQLVEERGNLTSVSKQFKLAK